MRSGLHIYIDLTDDKMASGLVPGIVSDPFKRSNYNFIQIYSSHILIQPRR